MKFKLEGFAAGRDAGFYIAPDNVTQGDPL